MVLEVKAKASKQKVVNQTGNHKGSEKPAKVMY